MQKSQLQGGAQAPLTPSLLELHAPFGEGIERDSNLLETRLALAEYRARHGREGWRLFQILPQGRA
jgi:hypothetical protein